MSTETMRWLDRWLGVPLCFLVSLGAHWRSGLVTAAASVTRPRRVLCIQLAEMGSLVLSGPAVHWLQTQGVVPYFVSFARNRDCLTLAGLAPAGRVFLWRTSNAALFTFDLLRFLRWAWSIRFDAAIDFEPCARFSALLGVFAGARQRAGFMHDTAYRGRLHNVLVPYREDRHMRENFQALAAALLPAGSVQGLAGSESAWREQLPPLTAAATAQVDGLLQRCFLDLDTSRLVLLNPNAGDLLPQRRWPQERFVALAREVLERYPDACVGFIGGAADEATVANLAAEVNSPRCASLAATLEVAALPALFARSALLVSNDSGPAHLASLTQTPTLVLFGPETPLLYRPLGQARALYAALPCSPCIRPANQRRSSCTNNLCMQAISVDSVMDEVALVMDARVEQIGEMVWSR